MEMRMEQHVYNSMLAAARKAAPMEACGLIGGKDGLMTRFYELTNADASGEHYSMLPEEQFKAVKDMRQNDLKMLAIWHSHPASPARMSDEDLRMAYTPDVAYLIVSLLTDPPTLGVFVMNNGVPEAIEVKIVRDGGKET